MSDDLARVLADRVAESKAYLSVKHMARDVAEAVLASGVVVSADKVRAEVARLNRLADSTVGVMSQCFAESAAHMLDLLSEPATDAAPTGEAPRASWGVTGYRATDANPGHRSAVDATTPPATHPSDPRPARNAQEGEQR